MNQFQNVCKWHITPGRYLMWTRISYHPGKRFAKIPLPRMSSNTGVRTRTTLLAKLALDYTCLTSALSAVLSTEIENLMHYHFSVFGYIQLFLDEWLERLSGHVPTCHLVLHFFIKRLTVKSRDLSDTAIATWYFFWMFKSQIIQVLLKGYFLIN